MSKLKISNRFGVTPNDLLNDPKVSWKAKWLFWYLQSKPEERDFSIDRIKKDASDGRDATRNGILELEQAWYLHRRKYKNEKWQRDIEYTLYDTPTITDNPTWNGKKTITDNPTSENPTSENTQTNKERNSKKEIVKKNTSKEVQQSWTHQEIIEPLNEKEKTEITPPSPADPPLKKWPRIDIQELIYDIQKECEKNWIAYNTDKEREFARHILTAKQFAQFAERVGKTPHQMAISVLKASIQIWYWKWATAWPRSIYKEYAEVYNAWIQQNNKKPLSPIGKLC